jgi:hypothetical protein
MDGMCRSWGPGSQEKSEAAHRRQPCAVARASNNEDGPGASLGLAGEGRRRVVAMKLMLG